MFSEPASISSVSRTKFRLAGGAQPLILVPIHVLRFAVDTGTSTTAISPRLARELHLRTATMGPISTGGAAINVSATRIESLAIDGAVLRDADVIVGEFLEMLGKAIGTQLDGIAGYNFLKHYKVVIDYPNEIFALLPP